MGTSSFSLVTPRNNFASHGLHRIPLVYSPKIIQQHRMCKELLTGDTSTVTRMGKEPPDTKETSVTSMHQVIMSILNVCGRPRQELWAAMETSRRPWRRSKHPGTELHIRLIPYGCYNREPHVLGLFRCSFCKTKYRDIAVVVLKTPMNRAML